MRKCKCPQQKQIVFLDESYIHEHHVSQYGLGIKDFALQKPQGKGRRVVIAAAISEQGWLGSNLSERNCVSNEDGVYQNGSIRAWIANVGGDYHLNFNAENFTEYFQNCILQYLTQPSITVLDRARYHTVISSEEFNSHKARKNELKMWLDQKQIKYNLVALKEELKMIVLCNWIPPPTIIEQLADTHGLRKFGESHKIMYFPPYHPEYNPIEFAWGQVKTYFGMNPDYKIKILLEKTLLKALLHFSPSKVKNIINHIIEKIQIDSNQDFDDEDTQNTY